MTTKKILPPSSPNDSPVPAKLGVSSSVFINDTRSGRLAKKPRPHRERKGSKNLFRPVKSEFEEKLVKWKRVSKTTKGGRRGRIWTLAIVGNKKGSVGYGVGKAEEFPDAMKKAVKNALKNVVKVKINPHGTVYHENIGKHGASKLIIKPAKFGIGIIAGGPIKTVLELAGYSDIYSKNLGSSNALNMVQATINGLLKQRTPEEISLLRRGKLPSFKQPTINNETYK